ncbi:MAG: tRNA uridine-5-carboxymethylaminomethyl(34) synthesis GTPase MnmE [Candidatus Latescibacterota bacterium]
MEQTEHTIAALSTPPGESGVAVVRMSGGDALDILSAVYRCKSGKQRAGGWQQRKIYHGMFVNKQGEVIDEVMYAVMRGPDSYTGEDTVEVTCHGGMLIVNEILNELLRRGARAAQAGEFTKRAFINGKIDLIQAEAVCDLIHAKSELQRKVAHEQLAGKLSRQIRHYADEVLTLLGEVEVNIDFMEEGIETFDKKAAASMLTNQRRALADLLQSASLGRPFREGYNVVVSGPVNAGKSSLFNRIIGEERAIVTEIPGTTRDVLREQLIIGGLVFVLHDTAGLRKAAADEVESIGLGLAEQTAGKADLVVFVVDGTEALNEETGDRIARLDPARTILVLNKNDLPLKLSADDIKKNYKDLRVLSLSAQSGQGIARLKEELVNTIGQETIGWIARERIVLNSRLVALLETADRRAKRLLKNLSVDTPLELLAVEIRQVLACYEEATGSKYTDNLLDNIFSRFCIGK